MKMKNNKFLNIINKILNTHFGEEDIDYPTHFILISYSPIALRENITDEQNKLIYRYYYDYFLNVFKVKKYRYSEERLKALQEVYNIPIFDKTKLEQRFPIFAKILPSEIEYTK